MPSRNVGPKRRDTHDGEVPAEIAKREAQDRPRGSRRSGKAQSPVDAKHVDAPKRQDTERGHRRKT